MLVVVPAEAILLGLGWVLHSSHGEKRGRWGTKAVVVVTGGADVAVRLAERRGSRGFRVALPRLRVHPTIPGGAYGGTR